MKEIKDLKLKDSKALEKMSATDLESEIASSSKNLYVLSMKNKLGELKQPHLIKALRRYIARLKTLVNASND